MIEVLGLDGAGKTTAVGAVAELGFEARKVAPYNSRFQAEAAKLDVLAPECLDAFRGAAVASALLLEAADVARRPGEHFVYDRWIEAAKMFWSVKGLPPLPAAVVESLPKAALTILLDVDVETAIGRRLRPSDPDPDVERRYLESCDRYLKAAARAGGWTVIDATEDLEHVIEALRSAVLAKELAAVRG